MAQWRGESFIELDLAWFELVTDIWSTDVLKGCKRDHLVSRTLERSLVE